MQVESILTILDKPKHEQAAFHRAMQIQALKPAHVDLVSFCWHPMVEAKQVFDGTQRTAIKRELLRARKEWQRQLIAPEPYRHCDISLEVAWTKDIAAWTAKRLHRKPADLLVKTAHRRQSLLHSPLDWALLQRCPVPLLLTTNKSQRPSKRIIAAIDLEHHDRLHQRLNEKVMDAASAFADLWGATIHCICVVEYSKVLADLDLVDRNQHKRDLVERSQETLLTLATDYGLKKSQLHLPTGKVGERVHQLSHKLNADLLVVGTHARRLKERLHLGSTAEKILTKATCDVLSVPP